MVAIDARQDIRMRYPCAISVAFLALPSCAKAAEIHVNLPLPRFFFKALSPKQQVAKSLNLVRICIVRQPLFDGPDMVQKHNTRAKMEIATRQHGGHVTGPPPSGTEITTPPISRFRRPDSTCWSRATSHGSRYRNRHTACETKVTT